MALESQNPRLKPVNHVLFFPGEEEFTEKMVPWGSHTSPSLTPPLVVSRSWIFKKYIMLRSPGKGFALLTLSCIHSWINLAVFMLMASIDILNERLQPRTF